MKIELPTDRRLVHVFRLPIRWGDMDSVGHVNNTVYFRYLESARIAWFEELESVPATGDAGFLIANAFCNFIRQLEYPGEVVVKTFVGHVGRSSIDTWVTMERGDLPGVIHATGGATCVWVDYRAHKSRPFPDALRAKLDAAREA